MALVSNINPSVKFIHHSEENFLEPEAKKQEQRKAAAEAFKKTFGRECDWFDDEEEEEVWWLYFFFFLRISES